MNQAVGNGHPAIAVDEVFRMRRRHLESLTSGELIGRWLNAPKGFEPVAGSHFTFQNHAGGRMGPHHSLRGGWRSCANERLSYALKGRP